MSDYTNALAKFLQSEKQAFAEPQRMLWPFRRDAYTGNMGLGHSMFTESIQNGFNFPAKVMRGEVPMFSEYEDGKVHYSPEMIQGANDTAGLAMTGAIGLPKPANSVGSGGGGKMMEPQATNVAERQALPMDQASRLARAREMGFDTDRVWYHGGDKDITAFDPNITDRKTGPGFWLTDSPNYASIMAGRDGAVHKLYARTKNPRTVEVGAEADAHRDYLGLQPDATKYEAQMAYLGEAGPDAVIRDELLRKGARTDGVILNDFWDLPFSQDSSSTAMFMRNPANVRSVDAVFDPAKTRSANLLAANPREGAAAAMTTNTGQREENALMNVLRQYGLHY